MAEYQEVRGRYATVARTSTSEQNPVRPLLMIQISGQKKDSVEKPNTPTEWIDRIVEVICSRPQLEGHPYVFGYCLSTLTGDAHVDMGATQEITVGDLSDNEMDEPENIAVTLDENDVELVVREVRKAFLDTSTDRYVDWWVQELRRANTYSATDQDGPRGQARRELAALLTQEGAYAAGQAFAAHFKQVNTHLEEARLLPNPDYARLFPRDRRLGKVTDLPDGHPVRDRFGEWTIA